ncbi:hypothetical protein CC86DRAFT_9318 [Ophiobolus disseminans]|uniref:Uncharacterized protein n=1 Tax=Ophiobolus disseminans TaxID=1469910 RepID=A0A6A7AKA6_9PLEO|nr:hypothetical protein CC86DRAFT_9318 [Ophiobolus disseminans]
MVCPGGCAFSPSVVISTGEQLLLFFSRKLPTASFLPSTPSNGDQPTTCLAAQLRHRNSGNDSHRMQGDDLGSEPQSTCGILHGGSREMGVRLSVLEVINTVVTGALFDEIGTSVSRCQTHCRHSSRSPISTIALAFVIHVHAGTSAYLYVF